VKKHLRLVFRCLLLVVVVQGCTQPGSPIPSGDGGGGTPTPNSDASLANLILAKPLNVLTPAFSPTTLAYTTTMTSQQNNILPLTATTNDPKATLVITPTPTDAGVPINTLPTTISLVVTAQNGAKQTYSITVLLTLSVDLSRVPVIANYMISTGHFTIDVSGTVTSTIPSQLCYTDRVLSGYFGPVSYVANETSTLDTTHYYQTGDSFDFTVSGSVSSDTLLEWSLTLWVQDGKGNAMGFPLSGSFQHWP